MTHSEMIAFIQKVGEELISMCPEFHDDADWEDFCYNALSDGRLKITDPVMLAADYCMRCVQQP